MAITNHAIAQKIFEALRDSTALLAACEARFSKPPTVCMGLSGEQGPPPEDCPVFEVISWAKDRSETAENRSFITSLNLYLEDSEEAAATLDSGVRTKTQRGPESLETLIDLVLSLVLAALPDLAAEEISVAYDAVEYFPLFAGTLALTLVFPNLGGGGFEPTI